MRTEEWFNWKLRDNPFGKSIIGCAAENEKIVGCVAYGIQPFLIRDKKINGVISFETFVHPDYQGKGIFGELLQLTEKEVVRRNIDLMLNFPNSKSLRGFLNHGWKQIESPEYWIKGRNMLSIPLALKDIRRDFRPLKSNLKQLTAPVIFEQNTAINLFSIITKDYLVWRFFSYPVSEYVVIDTTYFYSIIRMGLRGKIKEAQVLFINIKDYKKFKFKKFLKTCKLQANSDIISFSISKYNPLKYHLKNNLFIKVPNRTNICYKILNEDVVKNEEVRKLTLNAINYHTY